MKYLGFGIHTWSGEYRDVQGIRFDERRSEDAEVVPPKYPTGPEGLYFIKISVSSVKRLIEPFLSLHNLKGCYNRIIAYHVYLDRIHRVEKATDLSPQINYAYPRQGHRLACSCVLTPEEG